MAGPLGPAIAASTASVRLGARLPTGWTEPGLPVLSGPYSRGMGWEAEDWVLQAKAANAERHTRTAGRRDLVTDLASMLFVADPIGLDSGTNTDEYLPEAETVVIGLPPTAGPDDVLTLLHTTFVTLFDSDIAGPRNRHTELAGRIWKHWATYRDQSSDNESPRST